MSQTISPFFRSPITDLTGGLLSHQVIKSLRNMKPKAKYLYIALACQIILFYCQKQLLGRCAEMEMDMADCLEAYGLDRGLRKCKDIIADFRECHTLTKQFKRFFAMREERDKQIAEGKLKGDKMYLSPRIDGY